MSKNCTKGRAFRTVCIASSAILSMGFGSVGTAATPKVSAERCSAAEALIGSLLEGRATALGAPAHNLRSASDQSIFANWPGGPPPREILASLNDEHPPSVLECSNVIRFARKKGLAILRDQAPPTGKGAETVFASLPALSADGTHAASVVTTMMGPRRHEAGRDAHQAIWEVASSR